MTRSNGLSKRLRSPVIDVGDRVVDGVPAWAKNIAIVLFGTNVKVALLAGIGGLLVVFAALVGMMTLRRRFGFGVAGVGLFGMVGSFAALNTRSDRVWWSPLPTIMGSVMVLVALAGFSALWSLAPFPLVRW